MDQKDHELPVETLYEGRWLHDPKYLDDYTTFWFRRGGDPRRYSF